MLFNRFLTKNKLLGKEIFSKPLHPNFCQKILKTSKTLSSKLEQQENNPLTEN